MPSRETLEIDLREMSRQQAATTFAITDSFFKNLDQEEILGGNFEVSLKVHETAGDWFEIAVAVTGEAVVMCDRCLDDLQLPVKVEDVVKVYAGTEEQNDPDVNVLLGVGYKYDLSWDVYELIELSLPLQRVHDMDSCNPDMLDRLAELNK